MLAGSIGHAAVGVARCRQQQGSTSRSTARRPTSRARTRPIRWRRSCRSAMMFRHTFARADIAERIERAVRAVLATGLRDRRHRARRRAGRRHARWATRRRSAACAAQATFSTNENDHARRVCRMARHGGLGADAADARGARLRADRAGVLHDVERRRQRPGDRQRHAGRSTTRTTSTRSRRTMRSSPARAATTRTTCSRSCARRGWKRLLDRRRVGAAHERRRGDHPRPGEPRRDRRGARERA